MISSIKLFIILVLFNIYLYQAKINWFISLIIFITKYLKQNYIIFIDSSGINSIYGPGSFLKGIYQVLPFINKKCIFVSKGFIKYFNNYFQPDFYYNPSSNIKENQFRQLLDKKIINKYILGPNFVPNLWFNFPDSKLWKEKHFSEILNSVKGIVIHSVRVRDFLAQKSNNTNSLRKFIIMRPCTNLKPKVINSFEDRKIDIIFFEKYMDLNRIEQGKELLKLFKLTKKKIVILKYGHYNKKIMNDLANDSKFIIYFSFYDTGAIGLKEIQNYGVFAFTHQKDLVICNETTFHIPELETINNINLAAKKILEIIENVSKKNPESELIAEKNQKVNKCENALNDLCKRL